MDRSCPDKNPLQRNGTSQDERTCGALEPGGVVLHDMSMEDWVSFASEYARQVHFYKDNPNVPQGDWQTFFPSGNALASKLQTLLKDSANDPHTGLFLAFLHLMEVSQSHLNTLTHTHLDFYYKRVLQLSNQPFTPDKVHVIFELAKNAVDCILRKDTALNGGKDNTQKIRNYKTTEEIVVNTAKVADLKTVFHDRGTQIHYAEISNSSDGLGAALDTENPKWSAFGHNLLPAAQLGFALSSEVLVLREGVRAIRFRLTLESDEELLLFSEADLQSAIEVFLSGEKTWLGPFTPAGKNTDDPESGTFLVKSGSVYTLQIEIVLGRSEEAVSAYNDSVLKEHYNTAAPVAKFILNNRPSGTMKGYAFYNALMACRLKQVRISVAVSEMKDLTGENDIGILDLSKPFYPFGPQPIKGSNFYIGSSEVFAKDSEQITLHIEWKDLPKKNGSTDFREHYNAYRTTFRGRFALEDYTITATSSEDTLIVDGNDYFQVDVAVLDDKSWKSRGSRSLFDNDDTIEIDVAAPPASPFRNLVSRFGMSNFFKSISNNYVTSTRNKSIVFDESKFTVARPVKKIVTENLRADTQKGFIRLSLQENFLHDMYPRIYAISLMDNATTNKLVPHEPYTPVIAGITLDYKATAEHTFDLQGQTAQHILDNYHNKNIELFHIGVLGQYEQHRFLKDQHALFNDNNASRQIFLLPQYPSISEFCIGLSDVKAGQSVALLIAVAEGSENPELPTFEPDEKLQWDVLCSNEWKPLNTDYLIGDDTNNLLRSGILKIQIPKQATLTNSRLPKDRIWLRVTLDKDPDTVCRFLAVLSQAALATFDNRNNELSHLTSALPPNTISKLIDRPALIKAVTQPFASFAGRQPESDEKFYIRVSERLRHKQRAVAIWDYEHLILQQFPSVYKVRCLNHTRFRGSRLKEMSPGHVTAIVVPDLKSKNLYNRLQPGVSQNTLSEIEEFIRKHISLHVRFDAANPVYEEVRLEFKVLFRKRFDVNYYTKQLNEDIIKFLSPWAYDNTVQINFGGTLYSSVVISYLEGLDYVDFISDFRMFHEALPGSQKVLRATNSAAILVSAETHNITTLVPEQICV